MKKVLVIVIAVIIIFAAGCSKENNYTVNEAVKRDIKYALSNTLGFGGHNGVLCLKKWEE